MKRFLALLLVLAVILSLGGCAGTKPKVAVLWHDASDAAALPLRTALDAQLDARKLKYENFDAAGNQSVQLAQVTAAVEAGYTVLAVSIASTDSPDMAAQVIAAAGSVPVIFFNRPIGTGGEDAALLEGYTNVCFIGPEPAAAAHVQGSMIGNYLLENYDTVDLNGDTVITYAMLRGDEVSEEAAYLTRYGVEDADVLLTGARRIALSYFEPTNRDKYQLADWSAATAMTVMNGNLTLYNDANGNMIELVICNSDAMAAGAITALQSMGYNLPGKHTIPVFGAELTDSGRALIATGAMTGSVKSDPEGLAYAVAETAAGLASRSAAETLASLAGEERFYADPDCAVKLYTAFSAYTGE